MGGWNIQVGDETIKGLPKYAKKFNYILFLYHGYFYYFIPLIWANIINTLFVLLNLHYMIQFKLYGVNLKDENDNFSI